MPINLVSGIFQYPYTFLEWKTQQKSLERKNNEQPKIAVDGIEHTVRTTDIEILHRQPISTSPECERPPVRFIEKTHLERAPVKIM